MIAQIKPREPAHSNGRRKPLTLAVTSGKGGAGKTSVSANLGAALSAAGKRVLLVDADLGLANLDIILGLEARQTVADVLSGSCAVKDVLLKGPCGLTLFPSASGLHELTQLDAGQQASLFAGLEAVERDFDVVILDCAAGIGSDVQLFAALADEVLMVSTPDPTSLADAYALMKVLHGTRGRRSFRLVATMVSSERQARSVFGVLSKVSDQYLDIQLDLLGWVPHDDSWRRAVLERRLAFATNPAAAASRCIQRVAERLIALDAADGGKRAGIGALLLGGQG